MLYHDVGVWPDLFRPAQETLRRPFLVFAMRLGHMIGIGAV